MERPLYTPSRYPWRTLKEDSSLTWEFRYAEGHQDKHLEYGGQPIGQMGTTQFWSSYISQGTLTIWVAAMMFHVSLGPFGIMKKKLQNPSSVIYNIVYGWGAFHYWEGKDKVDNHVLENFAWEAIGSAMANSKRSLSHFVTMHTAGMWSGEMYGKMETVADC